MICELQDVLILTGIGDLIILMKEKDIGKYKVYKSQLLELHAKQKIVKAEKIKMIVEVIQ